MSADLLQVQKAFGPRLGCESETTDGLNVELKGGTQAPLLCVCDPVSVPIHSLRAITAPAPPRIARRLAPGTASTTLNARRPTPARPLPHRPTDARRHCFPKLMAGLGLALSEYHA
jgi:hypothetical protein